MVSKIEKVHKIKVRRTVEGLGNSTKKQSQMKMEGHEKNV